MFCRLAADCLVHGPPDNCDETPHLVPGSIGILNDQIWRSTLLPARVFALRDLERAAESHVTPVSNVDILKRALVSAGNDPIAQQNRCV